MGSISEEESEATEASAEQEPLLPPGLEQWLRAHAAELGICLFLVLAALAVFGRTAGFEFVAYDDDAYVYANRHVKPGLTLDGIKWAFTHAHSSNWHPLTWLSHMLDCQLYGQWAGGHHLTNVLLHAAASVVLFLALRSLTGATWPSGMVAALFCLHPLHVESVAWVAERKDVLSGLFFALTLWAYAGYVRSRPLPGPHPNPLPEGEGTLGRPHPNPLPKGEGTFSFARYALVVVLFALGLLCKPMLVTLPFVLLLLDYWPGRGGERGAGSTQHSVLSTQHSAPHPSSLIPHPSSLIPHPSSFILLLDKLPLLALSLASCVVTYWVQASTGAVSDVEPWGMRMQTALTAYVGYLVKMFWPFGLATPYPRLREPVVLTTIGCGLALAAITFAVIVLARRGLRYLAVGWFWYLGMLVPVIGLVTIGDQAMADRYTYLPLIGIFIALVWGGADLIQARRASEDGVEPPRRPWVHGARFGLVWGVAAVVLILCAVRSFDQLKYWSDSETFWRHAIAATRDNALAHTNLGFVLRDKGRYDEEVDEYQKALQIQPDYYLAHNNLGYVLAHSGSLAAAIEHYDAGLKSKPDYPEALNNRGIALATLGRMAEAEQCFRDALRFDPENTRAENNLGLALAQRGVRDEALEHLRSAAAWEPENSDWHATLGRVLAEQGNVEEGITELLTAIELKPDDVAVRQVLANIYFTHGNRDAAAEQWKAVLDRQPGHAGANKGVGMILMQAGQMAPAVGFLERAVISEPRDLESRKCLAFALLALGRVQDAIRQFQGMLRQDPNEQVALEQPGLAPGHAPGREDPQRGRGRDTGPEGRGAANGRSAGVVGHAGRRLCGGRAVQGSGPDGREGPGGRHAMGKKGPHRRHRGAADAVQGRQSVSRHAGRNEEGRERKSIEPRKTRTTRKEKFSTIEMHHGAKVGGAMAAGACGGVGDLPLSGGGHAGRLRTNRRLRIHHLRRRRLRLPEPARRQRPDVGRDRVGLYPRPFRELASPDDAFAHARLHAVWSVGRRAPSDERRAARGVLRGALSGPAANDGGRVAQRDGGCALLPASAARRVGGLGLGAEGRAERTVLRAHVVGLRGVCAAAVFSGLAMPWSCSSSP